jgi:hypothetical protein
LGYSIQVFGKVIPRQDEIVARKTFFLMGSWLANSLFSGSSKVTYAAFFMTCCKNVDFPDCLGPVIKTAGN